jgi:hypothetical protein
MAISASEFLKRFKQIKAYLDANPDAGPELREGFQAMAAKFKAAYSAEAFKQALTDDAAVPSDLEERLTSVTVLLNRERASRG